MSSTSKDVSYSAVRREQELPVTYARFTQALESVLGRMNLDLLTDLPSANASSARSQLSGLAGSSGFSLFQKVDHGGLLTAVAGQPTRAATYVFGNALIAVEMTRHDRRAGLYVPPRLYVTEVDPDRTLVTWDRVGPTMAQFKSAKIDEVATALDAKIATLIEETAKRAGAAEHA